MSDKINPQELLETLLTASKDLAKQGKSYAEKALDIPEEGVERDKKIEGLKKGAIASAVLFGLLGTKGGRSITGKAIKIGSIAALGTAAYKGYQHWQSQREGVSVNELDETDAQDRALLIISAMVSAANADGKLDDEESTLLKNKILDMNLSEQLLNEIKDIAEKPMTASQLCGLVSDDVAASEVYLATRMFIDEQSSEVEKAFLDELIKGLGLSAELITELESQIN